MPTPFLSSKDNENEILTEKNAKMYEEVLNLLNDDYERPENEILEEIAPRYDMTAEELKNFMYEYMDAYYDYMGE